MNTTTQTTRSLSPAAAAGAGRKGRSITLAVRFDAVRAYTLALIEGLDVEDLVPQSMPDASPGKWHLAHTTWFFDAVVIKPLTGHAVRPNWYYLFNSYYDTLGTRHPRPQRGLLTRPSLPEVLDYRREIEGLIHKLLADNNADEVLRLVEIGTHHEQQHQELLVTDIKHLLSHNALQPAWRASPQRAVTRGAPPLAWIEQDGEALVTIGHAQHGFCYDNEQPAHRSFLAPFALASRPVTCAEYLEFIADGGYSEPRLWLSDGWAARCAQDWEAPLYWQRNDSGWQVFTTAGSCDLGANEPVCHVSQYEADAYARWAGARLPTEEEWEAVAASRWRDRRDMQAIDLHPAPMADTGSRDSADFSPRVWEWTGSSYLPYPGFRPAEGALGEYNGKFMSGQMVLRGASVATPPGHSRPTYRNFFAPSARWQFAGLRLAKDLE